MNLHFIIFIFLPPIRKKSLKVFAKSDDEYTVWRKWRVEYKMDVSQVSMTSSMAAIVQELQTISEMQTAIMKSIAASQQQMAEMLHEMGVGQNIDIRA